MDHVTVFGFEAKDFLTYLGIGLVSVCLFVVRQWQAKSKEHEQHLHKLDEAVHAIQLQMVEQRAAQADLKEFQADIKELETRMMRVEHVLTRIDERLGGKRRASDPDPETLR